MIILINISMIMIIDILHNIFAYYHYHSLKLIHERSMITGQRIRTDVGPTSIIEESKLVARQPRGTSSVLLFILSTPPSEWKD